MEDSELRQYFINIDKRFESIGKRFDTLERFIKDQIEGLAIITGKSFALMHERFDEIDERFDGLEERMDVLEDRRY